MPFLIFNFTFLIYLYTMYPTISPYRDSGDMIVSAFTLGIAHPPAYPLYVLLGKIFTVVIPFANIAYRVNLMSAFWGALTCSVLYVVIKKIGERILNNKKQILISGSVVIVLLFCLSSSMHSLSIVSEMYSLNAFFAVLIIYLISFLPSTFYLLPAFLFGLALGNHHTLVLLLPGIIYLLIIRLGKTFLPFTFYLLPAFLLGFSVYLFLPVRSAQKPTANWGSPSGSLRNLYRVLTRADYGSIRLHPEKSPTEQNVATTVKSFFNFLNVLIQQFDYWIIPFLGLGIYYSVKQKVFWQLVLLWFFSGPVFFIVSNLPLEEKTSLPILEPYLMLPLLIFGLWVCIGFFYAVRYFSQYKNEKKISFLIITGLFFLIHIKLPKLNKRFEFIGNDYSMDLLKTLPPYSVLFNPDDTTTFTLRYQQECLGKRKDISLAVFYKTFWGYQQLKEKKPEILPDYEIKSGIELENILVSYNYYRLPFFSDNISKIPTAYKTIPTGLLYGNKEIFEEMFDFYILPPRTSGKRRFFTNQIINYYSAGFNNLGLVFNEKKLYNKSIRLFENAVTIDPTLSQGWNNLGVAYWQKGDYQKAAEYFEIALKYAPDDEELKKNFLLAKEKIK
ncbi:MAG: DUF2723 domain-containing protein [Elusimicrobiota bacterium]